MSNISEEWATYYSPVKSTLERMILVIMAQRTGDDGCDAYKSYATLAKAALCDPKTAQRVVKEFLRRGIIKLGDQRAAAHIAEAFRPVVYDIQIPYSWYSAAQMEHLNQERASKGRPPLKPEDRPDLDPAPERKERSDKGKAAPQRRPRSLGPRKEGQDGTEEGGTQNPPLPKPDKPQGGISSPGGVDSQSQQGGISSPGGVDSQSTNSFNQLPVGNSLSDSPDQLPAVGDYSTVGGAALAAVPAGKPDLALVPDPAPEPEPEPVGPPPVRVPQSVVTGVFRRLVDLLPEERRPEARAASKRVMGDIRAELAHRTPEELLARIERRWEPWRYQPEAIRSTVGLVRILVASVLPGRRCPDLRCDDGFQLDLGKPCVACSERADEVAAQRAKSRPAESRPPVAASGQPAGLAPVTPIPPPFDAVNREAQPDARPGFTPEQAAQAKARGAAAARAALLARKAQRQAGGGTPAAQTIMGGFAMDNHAIPGSGSGRATAPPESMMGTTTPEGA